MSFTFNFTRHQLGLIIPNNNEVDDWYDAITEILPLWSITSPERVAGWLSQTAHESAEFRVREENLNYSASRLNQVFPKYFVNAGRNARDYHRQPEKIANIVYSNRMGNGPPKSGDGWRFRGRGLIQLTGRNNYEAFAKTLDMSLEEALDYIETKTGAVDSACWYWDSRPLNEAADRRDIHRMTRLVNGGTHGLEDRKKYWNLALGLFTGQNITEVVQNETVREGDRGQLVEMVQRELGITVDGIFGPGTKLAVQDWQRQHGLISDGIVGPKTLEEMF